MDVPTFRAAVVGAARCSVRRAIDASIERDLATWDVRDFPGLKDLVETVETRAFFPELVIVCQGWRDEHAAQAVKTGLASLPVARWICVLGQWCESEGRHGSRWPLAVRVPLHSWETRLANEIAVVKGYLPALAITGAREEVFEFDHQAAFPKLSGERVTVAILSPDRAWQSWLADLCQQGGLEVAHLDWEPSPEILIVDLDPLTESTRARIQFLKEQHPQARFIGVMGLVPPEDRSQLQEVGVEIALSKLTPAAQLLGTILQLRSGSD